MIKPQAKSVEIPFKLKDIPRGWVFCDGTNYTLESVEEYLTDTNYNGLNKKTLVTTNKTSTDDPLLYLSTPDLVGKFILGSGMITKNDSNKNIYVSFDGKKIDAVNTSYTIKPHTFGGESFHVLTKDELPPHNHGFFVNANSGYTNAAIISDNMTYPDKSTSSCMRVGAGWNYRGSNDIPKDKLSYTNMGNGLESKPTNNMPPFYALTYIMKL